MVRLIILLMLLITAVFLGFHLKAPRADGVEHHGATVNSLAHAAECLACHDGTAARAVTKCIGVRCNTQPLDSHPVERPYPEKNSFRQYGDVVRSGIQLDDGQVSCISCHDLKNQAPGHPVSKGNLCFRCHIR